MTTVLSAVKFLQNSLKILSNLLRDNDDFASLNFVANINAIFLFFLLGYKVRKIRIVSVFIFH